MRTFRILVAGAESLSHDIIARLLTNPQYSINIVGEASLAARHAEAIGGLQLALVSLVQDAAAGINAARELNASAKLPLLFIAAPDMLADNINELGELSDDFILSPVQLPELEARLHLLLSRLPSRRHESDRVIELDNMTVDFARSCIVRDGETTKLSPIEAGLLDILMRNAPRVVSNDSMLARIWTDQSVSADTLRVHMHRLRSKLEADPHHPVYIRTERGVGYRFARRQD